MLEQMNKDMDARKEAADNRVNGQDFMARKQKDPEGESKPEEKPEAKPEPVQEDVQFTTEVRRGGGRGGRGGFFRSNKPAEKQQPKQAHIEEDEDFKMMPKDRRTKQEIADQEKEQKPKDDFVIQRGNNRFGGAEDN
jgi:hypothetical protein